MSLVKEIQEHFASDGINTARILNSLPPEYPAWTLRTLSWYGVGVECRHDLEFTANFSKIAMETVDVDIAGDLKHLLVLKSHKDSYRMEFAQFCSIFATPGKNGEDRQFLIENPQNWWEKWKELVGNRTSNREPYSILGEMIALHYLLAEGEIAEWNALNRGVYDIETNRYNVEVKSTKSRYESVITLSSQFQLQDDTKPQKLFFFRFEESNNGVSIDLLSAMLINDGVEEYYLEEGLTKLGVGKSTVHRKKNYRLLEARLYDVDENFPVIKKNSLKNEALMESIISLRYSIDLKGIAFLDIKESCQLADPK